MCNALEHKPTKAELKEHQYAYKLFRVSNKGTIFALFRNFSFTNKKYNKTNVTEELEISNKHNMEIDNQEGFHCILNKPDAFELLQEIRHDRKFVPNEDFEGGFKEYAIYKVKCRKIVAIGKIAYGAYASGTPTLRCGEIKLIEKITYVS